MVGGEAPLEPEFWKNALIVGVNLVIWTGLFLYLLRMGKQVRELEGKEGSNR